MRFFERCHTPLERGHAPFERGESRIHPVEAGVDPALAVQDEAGKGDAYREDADELRRHDDCRIAPAVPPRAGLHVPPKRRLAYMRR